MGAKDLQWVLDLQVCIRDRLLVAHLTRIIRRRRVKCDQGKPSCERSAYCRVPWATPDADYIRCIKSSIKCYGYAPPKILLFEPGSGSSPIATSSNASSPPALIDNRTPENLQLQSYLTTYPHSQELALVPKFGTEEECRSFQFFLEKTADLISVYSQPYLWTVLLPQATWHQPAIKHSLIALADLHQSLTTTGATSSRAKHNFICHYNNAIRALITDKPPVDVVLASCVIFWALENFNGSGQAAFDHLKAAVKILGEWNVQTGPNDPAHDLITTYIVPTIKDGIRLVPVDRVQELADQTAALSLSPQDLRVLSYDCPAFDTLGVACHHLQGCLQHILDLLFTPYSAELVESIYDIEARLCKWMHRFQKLTATGAVHRRRLLVLHNVTAHSLLDRLKKQAAIPADEGSRPGRCRFTYIVLEMEDMLKQDGIATVVRWAEATQRPLGWVFVPPVFLAASCAPKVENRRRAINILRASQLHRVEGPFIAELAANIAEAMLDIVHRFSIPAQEVEMRHMEFGLAQDRSTLHVRWKPDLERLQGVSFSIDMNLDAMPHVDSVRRTSLCMHCMGS